MRLYKKETILELAWPKTVEGVYSANYLTPLMRDGSSKYIGNVETTLMALHEGNLVLPVTKNDEEYENSYVCSPFGQYIRYGLDELETIVSSGSRPFLKGGLHCLGSLLKAGQINKTVQINNWLLSTNLYPTLSEQQVKNITDMLIDLFPDHALIFRSVNETQQNLLNILRKQDYQLLFSRQIFLLDALDTAPFKERHFKKDLQLLKESGYEVVEAHQWSIEDAPRIAELYRALNIEKHSRVNPIFTDQFVELCIKKGALKFRGLRQDGILDAVYGAVHRENSMVAPFFGYDTAKPEKLGIYRQLSALAVLEAKEKGMTLNQSGGAASFKKRRKAKPTAEYHAIYTKHLPLWRQAAWQTLKQIGDKLIVPFVERVDI